MEAIGIKAGWYTDKGPMRRRNEDVALALPQQGALVVADGLGGAAAGDRAARVATTVLSSVLLSEEPAAVAVESHLPDDATRAALKETIDPSRAFSTPASRLELAFMVAHFGVLADARRTGFIGMGAAVVCAWLHQGLLWIGHVGDCRAYTLSSGALSQHTRDHSLSEALASRNAIPKAAADSPFLRSRLTQVVGGEAAPTPDVCSIEARPGMSLLLCSDGVWGSLGDEDLRAALGRATDARSIARHLVESAISAGSRDNATALVAHL
jgi:protein phosphatase